MDDSADCLPKTSNSVLNLRLSTSLDASQVPTPAASARAHATPSGADVGLDSSRPLYSTASMYGGLDTQRSFTTDALGSKVSLWDLRCEVKTALETSGASAEATMRSDALQRILDVMREHVQHRKTQRNLKKEAKDAILRAEMAERETMALRDKVAALTQQLADGDGASCGSCDDADKPVRGRAAGAHDAAPVAPSRWLLSAQTTSDTAGPGSAALLTDDAPPRGSAALLSRESMDAKSLKSDGLMGDEVEGLMPGAAAAARGGGRAGAMSALMTQPAPQAPAPQGSGGSSPSRGSNSPGKGKDMLRSALLALADERRKNQNLEAQVAQLRGQLDEHADAADAATPEEPPLSARGAGWNLMSMLSRNSSMRGWQADNSTRLATVAAQASVVEQDESPTHGTVAEMMMALAETKVTCAEVQGKLTAARRDLARIRDVNAALTAQVAALTEERDGSWEEVGKMMVQIHMLKVRLEKHGVMVSAEELERAASSASAASLMSARRAASKTLSNSPGRASPTGSSPGRASTPPAAGRAAAAAAAMTSPGQESSAASSTAFHDLVG